MSSKLKPELLDSFQPNYKHRCIVCGAKPTVTGVKDGKVVVDTEMCGPCTWGDGRTIDPKTWNEPQEL